MTIEDELVQARSEAAAYRTAYEALWHRYGALKRRVAESVRLADEGGLLPAPAVLRASHVHDDRRPNPGLREDGKS